MSVPTCGHDSPLEALEEWLAEVRTGIFRANAIREAGLGQGRIAVRAPIPALNWLRKQLTQDEWYRVDFVAL